MKNKRLISITTICVIISFITLNILVPYKLVFANNVKESSEESNNKNMLNHESILADNVKQKWASVPKYDKYILEHKDVPRPEITIVVEGNSFAGADNMEVEHLDSLDGAYKSVVKTGGKGSICWDVEIPEDGLYNMAIRYFPTEGNASQIEREIKIDGTVPFDEARRFVLWRMWQNDLPGIQYDEKGNELRPTQVESPTWKEQILTDSEGYYTEAFLFYLSEGKHRITLISHREPMIIDYLKIYNEKEPLSYTEVKKSYQEKGYKETKDKLIKIQGEDAVLKSSPSFYPINDRTSPTIEPYHVWQKRLNAIGGNHWKRPGQWIMWEFDVEEDGLYELGIKFKQNFVRGSNVIRKLYIDDKIPFKETKTILFKHDSTWQIYLPGTQEEPYLFYLTKGKHTLTLEVTMGEMSDIVRTVRSSINELNILYRKIIMITGTSPDIYRDYRLENQIPDIENILVYQSEMLNKVADDMDKMIGSTSDRTTILRTTAYQLIDISKNPETVSRRLEQFKDNIMSLGTWLLQVNEAPLVIDYLFLKSPNTETPKANANFFGRVKHNILSFVYTFGDEYKSLGDNVKSDESINVWVGTGKDQAQIIKNLIENTFTPKTGINVTFQLINSAALLPAILAGQGPDICLSTGNVVDLAMRNALVDFTQFNDFDQVKSRFMESAFEGLKYQKGVYAIPEIQPFPMLFYRKDILEELKLNIPNTWDDLYYIIPELQKHNMQLGMTPNLVFEMLLYQNGGQYYKSDGIAVDIDSPIGVEAFIKWTELYTNYKIPREFEFINRFRTGEMPIGVAEYNTYNTLVIAAPEIRGQWGFAPLPGTMGDDGQIDRSAVATSNGTIMLKHARDKQKSWEFVKWWTDTEAQVIFGREIEAILGESGRYSAANIEVFSRLPWSAEDYELLLEQWKWIKGMPVVPGSYSLTRHLQNAFFEVYNDGSDPREVLEEYVYTINEEITVKREEFNLPTLTTN